MASIAVPPRKQQRLSWRLLRWSLVTVVPLLMALVFWALLRPLDFMVQAVQLRLWADGIHSEYTSIPVAGVGQVRIHYYAGGSGTPVVLVHGLGGRAEDWANLMPRLVRDHHSVYALDLPGYGRSAWPRQASYSIREETNDVEAFLDRMHLARTDLGGWSMGGWITMQVALDQPQRIRRLMIFDSAGITFPMDWDASLFEPDTPEKLTALDDLLMPHPPRHVPGFVERNIFAYVGRHGWVVRRNMDAMLTRQDLLDGKLSAIRMPMLIVWGKQDRLIPLSVGQQIHSAVPQSELEILDGCGHLAPAQCSGRVAPVVNGFLDEPSPIGGRVAEIR